MKILKGAEVSAKIKEQITQMMEGLEDPVPKLAIVRVGEKPDDMSYERGAVKKMKNFGLRVQAYTFPEQISDSNSKAEFSATNRGPDVSGILPLCPLPEQIAETDIEKMIDPERDPNGTSPANIAKVFIGDKTGFAPCITEAVVEVFKANEIDTTGKNATIVNRSMVVGRPLSMLVLREDATVTVCHIRARDLGTECRKAEIPVVAAGKARMLDGRHVGQDAIVIDVGINVDESGRLCGDVDFPSIESLISMATSASGGVGAVTTVMLAKHLVFADQRQRGNQMASLLTLW